MRHIVEIPALDMGKDLKENKGKPANLQFFAKEDEPGFLFIALDPKGNAFKVDLGDIHKALQKLAPVKPFDTTALNAQGSR